jgi:hypothetical protein
MASGQPTDGQIDRLVQCEPVRAVLNGVGVGATLDAATIALLAGLRNATARQVASSRKSVKLSKRHRGLDLAVRQMTLDKSVAHRTTHRAAGAAQFACAGVQ